MPRSAHRLGHRFGWPHITTDGPRDLTFRWVSVGIGTSADSGPGLYIPMQQVACYVGGGFLLDWFLLPVSMPQGPQLAGPWNGRSSQWGATLRGPATSSDRGN